MGVESKNREVVAIFDVDKTLLPGYSIIDFASFLTQKGNFKRNCWEEIEELIRTYKNKVIDYNQFADGIVSAYARGIAGQEVEIVEQLSSEFWSVRMSTVFPFVALIMQELAELDAKKIAVSGSAIESLSPLLYALGFDEAYTTLVGINEGKYTDVVTVNAASQAEKDKIVARIMKEIPQEVVTYGYGDSIADLSFLSLVTIPTVVGTHDKELNSIAKEKGWKIETSHERTL